MSEPQTCRDIGAWISTRRRQIGLTLNDLETLSGVSRSSLIRLQDGNAASSIGNVIAVVEALGGCLLVMEASDEWGDARAESGARST